MKFTTYVLGNLQRLSSLSKSTGEHQQLYTSQLQGFSLYKNSNKNKLLFKTCPKLKGLVLKLINPCLCLRFRLGLIFNQAKKDILRQINCLAEICFELTHFLQFQVNFIPRFNGQSYAFCLYYINVACVTSGSSGFRRLQLFRVNLYYVGGGGGGGEGAFVCHALT